MPPCVQPIRVSRSALLALLLCLVVGPDVSSAFANSPRVQKKRDTKRQVEILEEQWRTAQLAGDAATMDKLLSDDYIGISMSGQVNTKAQQLERVRAHKVMLSRVELSDMKVKLIGGIAIVTSEADVEGTNESGSIKGKYRYTRVYQRLPSGVWKITSFEATRIPTPKPPKDSASAEQGSSNKPLVSQPQFR